VQIPIIFPGITRGIPLKLQRISSEADLAVVTGNISGLNLKAMVMDDDPYAAISGEPVVILASSRERAFTEEEDLAFLGPVANQIALAVQNAVAYGEISQLKDRLVRENVYLESETAMNFISRTSSETARR